MDNLRVSKFKDYTRFDIHHIHVTNFPNLYLYFTQHFLNKVFLLCSSYNLTNSVVTAAVMWPISAVVATQVGWRVVSVSKGCSSLQILLLSLYIRLLIAALLTTLLWAWQGLRSDKEHGQKAEGEQQANGSGLEHFGEYFGGFPLGKQQSIGNGNATRGLQKLTDWRWKRALCFYNGQKAILATPHCHQCAATKQLSKRKTVPPSIWATPAACASNNSKKTPSETSMNWPRGGLVGGFYFLHDRLLITMLWANQCLFACFSLTTHRPLRHQFSPLAAISGVNVAMGSAPLLFFKGQKFICLHNVDRFLYSSLSIHSNLSLVPPTHQIIIIKNPTHAL